MVTPQNYGYESWESMALDQKEKLSEAERLIERAKGRAQVAVAKLETLVVMLESRGIASRRQSKSILDSLADFLL